MKKLALLFVLCPSMALALKPVAARKPTSRSVIAAVKDANEGISTTKAKVTTVKDGTSWVSTVKATVTGGTTIGGEPMKFATDVAKVTTEPNGSMTVSKLTYFIPESLTAAPTK